MSKALVVHPTYKPNKKSVENKDLRFVCEVILDHWREFTGKQVGIAASLRMYENPAEMMTGKQEFNIRQAMTIAEEAEWIPFSAGK